MALDHVKWRLRRIHWGLWLLAIAIPICTWVVARTGLDLRRIDALLWSELSFIASMAVLVARDRFLRKRFYDAYLDVPSWTYLSERFVVAKRPSVFDVEWSGVAFLGDDTVAFDMEAAASHDFLYLNIHALDRLVVPWQEIAYLKKVRLPTSVGWNHFVDAELHDKSVSLRFSWPDEVEKLVPNRVGIGT